MHWCKPLPLYSGTTKAFFHASGALPLHQTAKMTMWSQATSSNLTFNNRAMIISALGTTALRNATIHSTISCKEGSSQTSPSAPREDLTSQTKVSKRSRVNEEMSPPPPKTLQHDLWVVKRHTRVVQNALRGTPARRHTSHGPNLLSPLPWATGLL